MKKLERSLSLPYVVAIGIGGMLGSGIFVLPGLAAMKTGPSVYLAYLLAGICVLPAALSKAELASAMPTSGGTYVYIERAFGPIMGTISGIGLWLSLLLKSSFALVGFGAYLYVFAQFPLKITALTFLVLIMVLNIVGVKKVGKVQLVTVAISLVGMALLLIFGLGTVEKANLEPFLTHGNKGLFAATAFVFVSYAGVTKVAAIAEEIKNPGRNLPLAMLLALFLITAIYVFVTFTLVGNIPAASLEGDIRPIYTLSEHIGGPVVGIFAAVLGVITLISMANSGVLAASRFPFAMSRDQLLPESLGRVHTKYLMPIVTIVATCALMAIVITLLDVEKIAKLASAFKVMMFILVNGCVIILRETAVQWYKPEYRSPLYPWIQIFGILSGLFLLVLLGGFALLAALGISLVGLAVYYLYGNAKVQRSGVLKLYGHRPALFLLYQRRNRRNKKRYGFIPKTQGLDKPTNLDGAIDTEAEVIVPLFGRERSPEILVEMGAALGDGKKIQIIHLKEIPEQTMLDALLADDVTVASLNRRIAAMADERQVNVDFDAAITHNLVNTVHAISDETKSDWLVMGWEGRDSKGIFVNNPMGWLMAHINCKLALFKDKGVRYIRKILVASRPGRSDREFVTTAGKIARFYDSSITLLRVVPRAWNDKQIQELLKKSEEMLDTCDSEVEVLILKSDHPVTTITEVSAGFDLLIIGTSTEGSWIKVLLGKKNKFTGHVPCSILRLTLE